MIKSEVKSFIRSAIAGLYPDSSQIEFNVEEPPSEVAVDLSSNAAFILSRSLPEGKKAPVLELAEKIASRIGEKGPIKKIEISKNGFLNFILSDSYLQSLVGSLQDSREDTFKIISPFPQPVLIEFVSANPTGPLHVGHGRGAALGDSLARIYRVLGIPVDTEYYVNDMGIQMEILSKSVETRAQQLQGKDVPFLENGYKGAYIEELAKRMLDEKRSDFSQFPKKDILDGIRRDLGDFGIVFDHWFFESSLHSKNKVEKSLELLREKNELMEKEGALWYAGRKSSKKGEEDKDRVLRKSDGKYTYFASDVAYHREKFERGFKLCIDIWGQDHHGYVPRLSSAVQSLGIPKDSLKILLYQLVSLKRGGKRVSMSTRAGEFVTLREVMDEVGRDACRFFFAMRSPSSQLEFDLDLAKKQSSENPVYYVQYLHARIASIFREAEKRNIPIFHVQETGEKISLELLKEKEERDLMKKIGFFRDVLENSLQIQSPHLISDYLMDLAVKFHKFYDKHRVLDAEPKLRQERLILIGTVQRITRQALSLLGVSAPEKM